jgi:hypothetical protein
VQCLAPSEGVPVSLLSRVWRNTKILLVMLVAMAVFVVILIDAVLGMATILYQITDQKSYIFLLWLALVLLAGQFLRVSETHRAARKWAEPARRAAGKMLMAALLGTIVGMLIWPAFDQVDGHLIGVAFGSLLGVTLELMIEIILLTRPL